MSCSLLRKVHATIPRLIQFDATHQMSLFGIVVTLHSYVNMQLILSMKSVENIVTLSFYVNADLSSVSHLTEISKCQIYRWFFAFCMPQTSPKWQKPPTLSIQSYSKKSSFMEENPQITYQCRGIFGEWPTTSLILRYTEYI